MKLKFKHLFKNQKGQSMVELALILPVIMLIICAVLEGGWMFSNQLMIANASREGARMGVIYSKNADHLQLIRDEVLSIIPSFAQDNVSVFVSYSNPISPRSGDVSVNVTYNVNPLTPIMGAIIGDNFKLSSKCVMKLE